MKALSKKLREAAIEGDWADGRFREAADALDRLAAAEAERDEARLIGGSDANMYLRQKLAAAERVIDAVGVLVEDSMERNGPQVDGDIVRAYRAYRELA